MHVYLCSASTGKLSTHLAMHTLTSGHEQTIALLRGGPYAFRLLVLCQYIYCCDSCSSWVLLVLSTCCAVRFQRNSLELHCCSHYLHCQLRDDVSACSYYIYVERAACSSMIAIASRLSPAECADSLAMQGIFFFCSLFGTVIIQFLKRRLKIR